MGSSESRTPKETPPKDSTQRTPVVVRARPQPKPQPTQAEKLEAAEKKINEIMQEVVTYIHTQPISTLQQAQTARFVSPFACLLDMFLHLTVFEQKTSS